MRFTLLAVLPMVALAGCAEESRLPPVSTAFRGSGSSMSEPEPANSLPRGSSVSEPLTGSVGDVGNTRVGPATSAPRGQLHP